MRMRGLAVTVTVVTAAVLGVAAAAVGTAEIPEVSVGVNLRAISTQKKDAHRSEMLWKTTILRNSNAPASAVLMSSTEAASTSWYTSCGSYVRTRYDTHHQLVGNEHTITPAASPLYLATRFWNKSSMAFAAFVTISSIRPVCLYSPNLP